MRFYPLDKLINLHDGYVRQFKIDAYHLLLIQQGGERYLIEANCPHRDNPFDTASIDDQSITCPRHGYRFALSDGALLYRSEETCRGLQTFDLVYHGNELGVMLDS